MKKYPAWYLAYIDTGFMMDTGYIRPDIAFKKGWDAALNWKRRRDAKKRGIEPNMARYGSELSLIKRKPRKRARKYRPMKAADYLKMATTWPKRMKL